MKNIKGFSAISVIILAVLIGGGYAVWQNKTITPPPTLPKGEGIESWKTYKDERYGFEVKYPGNYAFRKIGSMVTFSDVSNVPITLTGPLLGSANFNDLVLATHVLNIFGKTGNSDPTIFAKNNMSPSPELDYLNPDLALKFKANRTESVPSLPNGNYEGYVFQKNNEIYILYSLDTNTILSKMISTFKFTN